MISKTIDTETVARVDIERALARPPRGGLSWTDRMVAEKALRRALGAEGPSRYIGYGPNAERNTTVQGKAVEQLRQLGFEVELAEGRQLVMRAAPNHVWVRPTLNPEVVPTRELSGRCRGRS